MSGIRKQFESRWAWYRRNFTVSNNWKGQRILLHFGAVDWASTVYVNGRCVGTHQGGKEPPLCIPKPKLWSPSNPFLYDVKIILKDSLDAKDEVQGYFGMRKISLKTFKNTPRLALNNEFLFQFGTLDQGYWTDGIYTAPTDEALKWDIEQTKSWGFNMIRKQCQVRKLPAQRIVLLHPLHDPI